MERDNDGDDEPIEYTLMEAHELPVVDVSRSLKKALLSPAQSQIYRVVSKKIDPVCTLLYTVAFPIGASVLTVPAEHARILAIFKFAFQVPTLILTSAGLRLDLLRILVTTYEFWFFTVMNAVTCVIFSMHLGDLRMMLAPVYWYGIQMNVWADAKVQGAQLAQACALAAVYHVFLLIVFGLQLTPDASPVELVSQSGHTMSSTDFLLNSFTTMSVLMARTAYRKRALNRRSRDDPRVLRFVSYRCRVKFQRTAEHAPGLPAVPTQQDPTLPPDSSRPPEPPADATAPGRQREQPLGQTRAASPTEPHSSTCQRLRHVKLPVTFRSSNLVAPALAKHILRGPAWCLPLLYGVGAAGLSLHVVSYVCSHLSLLGVVGADAFAALALLALTLSSLFIGAFAVCYQRQLLRRLLTTFDFAFLSLQITLGYVCLCVIVKWDSRCYLALTGWLWLHWVMTLDALTPATKSALRFQSRFAIPALLLAAVMKILTASHILSSRAEELDKLVFLSATIFSRRVVVKAVPFYLSRGLTVLLWAARILWRLIRSDHDELTMIQGSVEFFANPKALHSNTNSVGRQLQNRTSGAMSRDRHRVQPE